MGAAAWCDWTIRGKDLALLTVIGLTVGYSCRLRRFLRQMLVLDLLYVLTQLLTVDVAKVQASLHSRQVPNGVLVNGKALG
jgi:hypothetical protein